jgi:hypothetical protein
VCWVSDAEFAVAKAFEDNAVLSESGLGRPEVALASGRGRSGPYLHFAGPDI